MIRTKTQIAFALCSLFLLAGCLQEDAVTVTKDGLVSFTSLVTEPDAEKKVEAAVLTKTVDAALDELRQKKWKAGVSWLSKDRPYRFKISGSGKLSDVVGSTSFYTLAKVSSKKYTLSFVVPTSEKLRVTFESRKDGAVISDTAGRPVHEIENAASKDTYTIALR